MTLDDIADDELPSRAPNDIVRFIRDEILSGAYQPGEALRQDAIARRFKVSKVPIREALKHLESEGLVVFHMNRGAVVRQYSAEEVREIGEISAIIEARLVRLSVPRMTFADHNNLQCILEMLEEEQDSTRAYDIDLQFRVAVIQRADRPIMMQMLRRYSENRALRADLLTMPTLEKTLRDYRVVLDAIRSNDADVAALVMQSNLMRIVSEIYRHLSSKSPAV